MKGQALRRSHIAPELLDSPELALIETFYGATRAHRSRVPLIQHIYEGLAVMARVGASVPAMRAYCLHPLLQNSADLSANFERVAEVMAQAPNGARVLAFALEYRSVANEYLANRDMPKTGIRLSPLVEVNHMLVGDKVQNQRDFLAYHAKTHPNAVRLTEYFEQWLQALLPGHTPQDIQDLTQDLPSPERRWAAPVPLTLVETSDGESFQTLPPDTTGLPVGGHPGAFGVIRSHHVHEGVDLYCPTGTPVLAVEGGQVVGVMPFTGPLAGMPWWLDTQVVLVEGASGVVAYGEISPAVTTGQVVQTGDRLGQVVQVLRHDKGRPLSMLHLELHQAGARTCPEWPLHGAPPETLLDPTDMLRTAIGE